MLYFLKADALRKYQGNLKEILGESWGISIGFNYTIWRMYGTTSGAYCQQWKAIHGATCICDAVFIVAEPLKFKIFQKKVLG